MIALPHISAWLAYRAANDFIEIPLSAVINKSFIFCQGFLHVNYGLSTTLTKHSELHLHIIF